MYRRKMTRKKDLVSSPRGLDDEERDEEVKEETGKRTRLSL